MKTYSRIICLLAVLLFTVIFVFFSGVNAAAADEAEKVCTLTVESTYSDSSDAQDSALAGMSFFGTAGFEGCYGNQLSDTAKELYDSLVEYYVTDGKGGEYTYSFDTPFTFDVEISNGSIVMNEEIEEISNIISCSVQTAMDAFLYDHPEVFWLHMVGSSHGISAYGNSYEGYVGEISDITITPIEIYDGASAKISQYNAAVNTALNTITVTESRYDTLKSIHDYICNKAWYNLINSQRVHSSEAFFIGDSGVVCEGYAKSFKVLCDRLDIPCVLVSGDAGGEHMWNYVQMEDGKWYLVDATWDDQKSQIYDTYFLANANTVGFDDVAISEERTERTDFSGAGIFSFTYPVLSKTAYTVHIHEWESEYTVDVEPTCTEKGSKSIHCSTCDARKSVTEIPATNHPNKTVHSQQNATCSEKGYTAGKYCPDCKKWIEGHTVIDALGHNWNAGVINPASTCKTYGTKTYTCLNDASHKKTENVALNPDNHVGGTYLKNKSEATCTSNGYTGDTYCSGCGVRLASGKVINALKHNMSDWADNRNGTHSRSCERAGCSHSETVSCSYTSWKITKSATCTEKGSRTKTCTVCGYVVTETIAKLEHIPADAIAENIVEAKCEVEGSYDEVVYCSVCDTELSREGKEIPALDHNWDNGVINPISTCKTHGTKTYTCQNDASHKKTELVSLDANNHEGGTHLKYKADATCTVNGYTGDTYCSGCNVKLSSGEAIDSLGHDMSNWSKNDNGTHSRNCKRTGCTYTETADCTYTEWNITKSASCTETGSKSKNCTVCGYVVTEAIEKLSHTPDKAVTENRIEPGCETKGSYDEVVYCSVCDTELSRKEKEISTLGHSMSEVWTSNKNGTHTSKCNRAGCNYTETAYCIYGGWITSEGASCTTPGTMTNTCKLCGYTITETTGSLSHKAGITVDENRTEPECDIPGSYDRVVYCSRCGVEMSRTTYEIPALVHCFDSGVITKYPTCKTQGIKTYVCIYNPSHIFTAEIPVDSDNHEGGTYIGADKKATCSDDGYSGDTYCNGCGVKISDGEKINALGHIMSETPSYDSAYTHTRNCLRENCGYSRVENCDFGEWIEITPPSCADPGEVKRICSECGYIDYATTDRLPHTQGETVKESLVLPTCTKEGSYNERIECSGCGKLMDYTYGKKIPALGHAWDEGVVGKASTCNAKGFITYSCRNDNSHTFIEYMPDFDYSNHDGIIYEDDLLPTCTSAGYKGNKMCNGCGNVVSYGETVPATNHKNKSFISQQNPNCTEVGYTAGEYCPDCEKWVSGHVVIPAASHKYEPIITPATLTVNGKTVYTCSCGSVEKTETIAKVNSFTLSGIDYVYNGKNKTPKVTVKDADGKQLVKNVDYKTSIASSRSNVGKYYVKVTLIGKYSGTKNVYFYIRPGVPETIKATQSTTWVKLTWDKADGAAGYTVYRYDKATGSYKKLKATTATSYTDKDLTAGTKYTYKVIAYGKSKVGNIYYSKQNIIIETATRTKTPAISSLTSTSKAKATVKWNNVSGETGYQVWYSTSKDGTYTRYGNAKANATSLTMSGLKSGRTYYVKIRTYTKTGSGYVYGSYSSVKSVKVR